MNESNTRKWWRSRIRAIVYEARNDSLGEFDLGGWLDDLMQTPELSLAELAESNPDYRLAVIDSAWQMGTRDPLWNDRMIAAARVVKVEER